MPARAYRACGKPSFPSAALFLAALTEWRVDELVLFLVSAERTCGCASAPGAGRRDGQARADGAGVARSPVPEGFSRLAFLACLLRCAMVEQGIYEYALARGAFLLRWNASCVTHLYSTRHLLLFVMWLYCRLRMGVRAGVLRTSPHYLAPLKRFKTCAVGISLWRHGISFSACWVRRGARDLYGRRQTITLALFARHIRWHLPGGLRSSWRAAAATLVAGETGWAATECGRGWNWLNRRGLSTGTCPPVVHILLEDV